MSPDEILFKKIISKNMNEKEEIKKNGNNNQDDFKKKIAVNRGIWVRKYGKKSI